MTYSVLANNEVYWTLVEKNMLDIEGFLNDLYKLCEECKYCSIYHRNGAACLFGREWYYSVDDMDNINIDVWSDPEECGYVYHTCMRIVDGHREFLEGYVKRDYYEVLYYVMKSKSILGKVKFNE